MELKYYFQSDIKIGHRLLHRWPEVATYCYEFARNLLQYNSNNRVCRVCIWKCDARHRNFFNYFNVCP